MTPTQRKAIESAIKTLEFAAYVSNRSGLMDRCERSAAALSAALAEADEPDLSKCLNCGGPADNGHDRCVPPNPYNCTKCSREADEPVHGPVAWRYKPMIGLPWSISDDGYYISCKRDNGYIVEALYTHPPRREPLADLTVGATWEQQK